ncbi:MAG TPA: metallophosphoesterase family protein [Anaerohalosphaeraceae bacterium]|nr:metallophosphoesterase family protein [Phycisphaerae bacterium]HPO70491.1 metallophosphoesterase family protein [Anaerohalosphaeraceae bacterium]HRV20610.1 metallophosphoesterase family protein [Anaerohalosphaeraceae bacterium]
MNPATIKLLVLADIHGRHEKIASLRPLVKDADAVILAGDITHFGGANETAEVLTALEPLGKPVFAVHGNCDQPVVQEVLSRRGISVHGCTKELMGLYFAGAGGSLGWSGATPGEVGEAAFAASLQQAAAGLNAPSRLVLITHQPPWGTTLDVQGGMRHTGSRTIRSFIEDHQPLLAVSGHIHEARGIDRLGDTVLVNPGPLRSGCYAAVEITNCDVQVRLGLLDSA